QHMGVVGAGFMGAAIAEVGAVGGLNVRVRDMKPEAVARGLANVRKMLSRSRSMSSRERLAIAQRVSGTTDYSGFAQADLVIEAVAPAVDVGVKMGKTVIVVGDSPGFYTSRVLGVMMNEAVVLLAEGARLEDVDRAITAFGFPVGPFVLYDEVGLAVAQHAGET